MGASGAVAGRGVHRGKFGLPPLPYLPLEVVTVGAVGEVPVDSAGACGVVAEVSAGSGPSVGVLDE